MITDRLDKCPFCDGKMAVKLYGDQDPFHCLECANQVSRHLDRYLWAFYMLDKVENGIGAINVRMGDYQLCWLLKDETTRLLGYANKGSNPLIAEFPFLLDFELTEENIVRRMEMIRTFV